MTDNQPAKPNMMCVCGFEAQTYKAIQKHMAQKHDVDQEVINLPVEELNRQSARDMMANLRQRKDNQNLREKLVYILNYNANEIIYSVDIQADHILALIDQEVLAGRIDELNRVMDADDENDETTYYPLDRIAELNKLTSECKS